MVHADAGTTENLKYPIVIEGIEPEGTIITIQRSINDGIFSSMCE